MCLITIHRAFYHHFFWRCWAFDRFVTLVDLKASMDMERKRCSKKKGLAPGLTRRCNNSYSLGGRRWSELENYIVYVYVCLGLRTSK
jgi:hypothetical protein